MRLREYFALWSLGRSSLRCAASQPALTTTSLEWCALLDLLLRSCLLLWLFLRHIKAWFVNVFACVDDPVLFGFAFSSHCAGLLLFILTLERFVKQLVCFGPIIVIGGGLGRLLENWRALRLRLWRF